MTGRKAEIIRRRYRFSGAVQGVGFRYRAVHAARETGVTGWVRNESDGTVSMEIQGTEEEIDMVLQIIRQSRWIDIRDIRMKEIPCEDERDFGVKDDWWY